MIARHESEREMGDVWAKLAAPLPKEAISWRQDGRPMQRDGKYFARFVSYIDAGTVRERLDSVVPGEWSLALELLPPMPEAGEEPTETPCAFKARLTILGITREDVGNGKDYKQASTDAFKRVAVRFGIGHELYEMGQNWVQMDGDGKYAKPLEDPQAAYERRQSRAAKASAPAAAPQPTGYTEADKQVLREAAGVSDAHQPQAASAPQNGEAVKCPKCGGRMWDNRIGKRNPKSPDFKCRDRSCDGVIWPPKQKANGKQPHAIGGPLPGEDGYDAPPFPDDIPF